MDQKVTEEFLCYLWKFQLIKLPLISTDNQAILVKKPGLRNTDGGPDFSNALIKIGKTLWAGNVEIHVKSSDWIKHNHQNDKKYENVTLHIVMDDDHPEPFMNFRPVATLELKNRFDFKRYSKYLLFMKNHGWIACESLIHQISGLVKTHFIQRLSIERLERRHQLLSDELAQNHADIERLFFIQLFKSFGFKTNKFPFEMLIKSIPLTVILKLTDNLFQLEALFFGQAGMLNQNFKDDYAKKLQNEYLFIKHKYSLKNIPGHLWQYLRLRPSNFPTIRIAQLASLINKTPLLFSKITESKNTGELLELFDVSASAYWNNHYQFDKESKRKVKKLGIKAAESIIINCVIPILFIYGDITTKMEFQEKALRFLENLKGEKNTMLKKWEELKLPVDNALQTQALIELKTRYCDFKKCLDCEFGCELLNKG